MPIPSEPVGSLPRSSRLHRALADFDAGAISRDALTALQDEACREVILRLESMGSPVLCDGEQRKSAFATYPLMDTLGGAGMKCSFAHDGDMFAMFSDGHEIRLPRLTQGPFSYVNYSSAYVTPAKAMTDKPLKQAVISPSFLSLLYPADKALPDYPRERFLDDVCDEAEKDIRSAFAAGAARVSIDFTEGRLACRADARLPWTTEERAPLRHFIELNNRVINRFSAEERANIGVHTCPGGDCDATHSADVSYSELLPALFEMNAGYFLIRCSGESDKESVFRQIGECLREDANGTAQHAFIGVTNPIDPRVETPEDVAADLLLAAKHIRPDRLGATDDCGFSPFSLDPKPRHGSPDAAREIAFQKMEARVRGAALASERLGL